MRADMDKVIVERPRFGSRMPSRKKGYRKYLQSVPIEDLPRNEPMLGRWRGRAKCLNEHLGPMRRFLRSNVGRPWNKVHQELCEHVSFDNAVQSHVLDHIYDYVHKHVEVEDRATVLSHQRRWGRGRQLNVGDMYVCPTTGILRVVCHDRRRCPPTRICDGPSTQYLLREGAWWKVCLRKWPDDPGDLWDVWLERPVAALTQQDCIKAYGGQLFATSKRPLKREETKQLYRKLRRKRRRK
jgi:hypothetical protein